MRQDRGSTNPVGALANRAYRWRLMHLRPACVEGADSWPCPRLSQRLRDSGNSFQCDGSSHEINLKPIVL